MLHPCFATWHWLLNSQFLVNKRLGLQIFQSFLGRSIASQSMASAWDRSQKTSQNPEKHWEVVGMPYFEKCTWVYHSNLIPTIGWNPAQSHIPSPVTGIRQSPTSSIQNALQQTNSLNLRCSSLTSCNLSFTLCSSCTTVDGLQSTIFASTIFNSRFCSCRCNVNPWTHHPMVRTSSCVSPYAASGRMHALPNITSLAATPRRSLSSNNCKARSQLWSSVSTINAAYLQFLQKTKTNGTTKILTFENSPFRCFFQVPGHMLIRSHVALDHLLTKSLGI